MNDNTPPKEHRGAPDGASSYFESLCQINNESQAHKRLREFEEIFEVYPGEETEFIIQILDIRDQFSGNESVRRHAWRVGAMISSIAQDSM